ncbi:hypothetical protein F4780DRAFT_774732 [Xylariomycetidae sp. FL0641]|nr:hypothetical protein F4780DRAFT_774732 [Xylariomycetidae sp. FL0641]
MSSNNDNAMTRFLFAILKQKNLKDIDWNQVAHDPILAQEITNGHAARMRYSRFRTSMLGTEPTRRNRAGPPKSRVTKPKKDGKGKKDDAVKSEPAGDSSAPGEPSSAPSPPNIKQETPSYGYDNRLTPGLTPAPMTSVPTMASTPVIQPRLLTPCSDTDAFATASALASSPAPSHMMNSTSTFDFATPPCPDHIDPAWQHHSPYSAFTGYHFDHFDPAACDPAHMHTHHPGHLTLPCRSTEDDNEHLTADMVKREDWDPYQ